MKLSHYVSAVLVFAVARPDTMEETAIATQPGSAVLSFAPHPIASPVKGRWVSRAADDSVGF